MTEDLAAFAARISSKRRELEHRLRELHEMHPLQRTAGARLVAACFFELLEHQAAFNDAAIARISALESARRDTAPGVVL